MVGNTESHLLHRGFSLAFADFTEVVSETRSKESSSDESDNKFSFSLTLPAPAPCLVLVCESSSFLDWKVTPHATHGKEVETEPP